MSDMISFVKATALKKRYSICISSDYFGSSHMDDVSISDEILTHMNQTKPELKDWYCSFLGDESKPISDFRTVYWFDEKKIGDCLQYENDHGVWIFPRYHYRTKLVERVNSLLEFNYFKGKSFDQAKADHQKENIKTLEDLNEYAYENNLNPQKLAHENNINDTSVLTKIIEQNQDRIANDPIIPAKFLKLLTSGPAPLVNLLTEGVCDYLWAKIKPFEDRDFPESFVDEIDDITLKIQAHEKFDKHVKMAKRVRENYTKQYVQEFLKDNLVDFLEEYEGLIRSNEFSYADVWQLKESYLEGLYKETIKGLSDDAPYVMKKEGKAWKIVFNRNPMSSLRRIGFTYLYHLICHPNEYFFHADLFIAAGKGVPVSKANDNVEYVDANGKPVAIRMIDDKGLQTLRKQIKKLRNELSDAKEYRHNEKVLMLEEKLQQTRKFLSQVYDKKKNKIRYIKDANTKKVTDSVGKAIKRALEDIQQEDPNAYQHFSNAIGINNLYQDSLMYRPAPEKEINWITIG